MAVDSAQRDSESLDSAPVRRPLSGPAFVDAKKLIYESVAKNADPDSAEASACRAVAEELGRVQDALRADGRCEHPPREPDLTPRQLAAELQMAKRDGEPTGGCYRLIGQIGYRAVGRQLRVTRAALDTYKRERRGR